MGAGMISDFTVRHHTTIGSTNDEARRLAATGAPSGTVVLADEQTAGRGRWARRWYSPPGNLYMSILLRTGEPVARTAELGFVTAVVVAETVEALLPKTAHVQLKWPNDVLVDGAKISGILVEQAEDAAIVGIGLNILHAPTVEAYRTTTIIAHGGVASVDWARNLLLERFRERVNLWQQDGFPPIRDLWIVRSSPIGSPIQVNCASPVCGRFAGMDHDGALLVDTDAGRRRILAGEVLGVPA